MTFILALTVAYLIADVLAEVWEFYFPYKGPD